MAFNAMYLLLIIFLFLWTKNPISYSEIHSPRLVTSGSSFKLKCPIKTNNHYSVRWFKDGKELCRYSDKSKLNATNILKKNKKEKTNFICESTNIDLMEFDDTSSGLYTCHVVVEVEKRRKIIRRSVSVLVYPTTGPVISGIKSAYEEGEIIQAICTAPPSNPPPGLVWYINGVIAYGWSMLSYPCKMTNDGLCVLRLGLRISATRNLFPNGIASFVCEAGILALPPKRAFTTSVLKGANNTGNINLLYGGAVGSIIWQILLFI